MFNKALETTRLIRELAEKRRQQEKLLGEMEYVLYLKYLWEAHDPEPFVDKSAYYAKFNFKGGARTKGWIAIVRVVDKTEIRLPIHMKYVSFAGGVTDMWDNGTIPERFFEIFFEREGAKERHHDIGPLRNYLVQRDKRLKDNETFKETYGHYRTLRPLVGPLKVTASGDEIPLDSLSGDGRVEEVESPKSKESSEGQEGKEVA